MRDEWWDLTDVLLDAHEAEAVLQQLEERLAEPGALRVGASWTPVELTASERVTFWHRWQ